MKRILIFDTTLRDGEQSPGSSMTPAEKLRLAHQLDALGVDVLEAGFPISSPADHSAVRQIAQEVRRPVIAALARACTTDIERAAAALEPAERSRIHVFIATSDLHLQRKLRISRQQCLERVAAAVELARQHCDDVEFSAEDATRSDYAFLREVVAVAITAGARTINLPDTVGYSYPAEYRRMFEEVRTAMKVPASVVWSAHCHDDLGLASANSLAAIEGGASQIECTINGIGERAGNAALEEIALALYVRHAVFGCETGIVNSEIHRTSHLLAHITGNYPPANKAIVGKNAFAHEAGIHQDGVIKDPTTYEIMKPELIGLRESQLVLGKHSGRTALSHRYRTLGYELDEPDLERVYELFKLLADRKKQILDEDLLAILHHGAMDDVPQYYRLRDLEAVCGAGESRARVRLQKGAHDSESFALGDGPIAAVFSAIAATVDHQVELEDLAIHAVTPGADAVGEVSVQVRVDGKTFTGRAASPDIVNGAARAYLQALNKAAHVRQLEAATLERESYLWGV
ncbi:MAG: 2-isopropylmalate synthase [Gemmatimonadota bacterium]